MYFPRHIDPTLREWSDAKHHPPLILRGARQTGKSASVRKLGESFDLFVELNLEARQAYTLVAAQDSPEQLLRVLLASRGLEAFPARTLLFFDEIQQLPKAISWLRFFHEDHPHLHVVAAGSLLGVYLQERGFSFPVGRVTYRTQQPLSFLEFLRATGDEVLARMLADDLLSGKGVQPGLHHLAMLALKDYLYVGGMPGVIARWLEAKSAVAVGRAHYDLLGTLADDLHKYQGEAGKTELEAVFDNLRHHYGLRFRYENFAPGLKSQRIQAAVKMFEAARLITRAWPTSELKLPLRDKARSAPKLLALDIGLALHTMGTGYESFSGLALERLLDGRAAELLVGQQLRIGGSELDERLYFWVSESSRANAETDFLLPGRDLPVPVEVKSGASGTLKSLHQFLWRSGQRLGLRFHAGPYADERLSVQMPDGRMDYRLLSVPLYLAELAHELVRVVGREGRVLGSPSKPLRG